MTLQIPLIRNLEGALSVNKGDLVCVCVGQGFNFAVGFYNGVRENKIDLLIPSRGDQTSRLIIYEEDPQAGGNLKLADELSLEGLEFAQLTRTYSRDFYKKIERKNPNQEDKDPFLQTR